MVVLGVWLPVTAWKCLPVSVWLSTLMRHALYALHAPERPAFCSHLH